MPRDRFFPSDHFVFERPERPPRTEEDRQRANTIRALVFDVLKDHPDASFFTAHFFEGLSVKDIADDVGKNKGNVYKRFAHIKQLVRYRWLASELLQQVKEHCTAALDIHCGIRVQLRSGWLVTHSGRTSHLPQIPDAVALAAEIGRNAPYNEADHVVLRRQGAAECILEFVRHCAFWAEAVVTATRWSQPYMFCLQSQQTVPVPSLRDL